MKRVALAGRRAQPFGPDRDRRLSELIDPPEAERRKSAETTVRPRPRIASSRRRREAVNFVHGDPGKLATLRADFRSGFRRFRDAALTACRSTDGGQDQEVSR